ncbi:MAG: heavy metal translocating P-type ATPase [Clostridia bacterium]|nr:heavy metal translocating P-type ATPase [Clostridia bacterium]
MKYKFDITGMSCAACSSRVEKAVSSLDGITDCSVNLLTNSMICEGDAEVGDIINAVKDAGYGAFVSGENKGTDEKEEGGEFFALRKRLISSLIFLLVLMYVSMGHMMLGFPLPHFVAHNPVNNGIIQLILSGVILFINRKFFINGFKGLIKLAPNMDTLVAIGSGASFVYSLISLFNMTDALISGDVSVSYEYLHEFYFESAAMILTLITVGKMLEAYSKGKTTGAIKALLALTPQKANIIRDGDEITVDASELMVGDIFVVRPGEAIAADGVIVEGMGSVDESMLTGESIPVDKAEGDKVSAATINKNGFLKCRVTGVGEDTALAKIIKLVTDASSGKAPIAKIADKVSGVFVPFVIVIAIITAIVWSFLGESASYCLSRAISVLVISCPCSLGLATPVAIMVGSGLGAKNGILFKTAESLEHAGRIKVCVFDKTGTLTHGKPVVTDVVSDNKVYLMQCAYSLEKKSEHPLADAVTRYAEESDIQGFETENFEIHPGNGLSALYNGKILAGGNYEFIKGHADVSDELKKIADIFSNEGKTPLYFSYDGSFLGAIFVSDSLKPDTRTAIDDLKKMNIKPVMLTGDNEKTAKAIASVCGIDDVIAGVNPSEKEKYIRELSSYGSVCMVGDGINDAPALTSADVGIAVGAGTDIAIDAADVVIAGNSPSDVVSAIRLSKKTLRNIKENLFWAFIYNIVGIPLAAGVWIGLTGWEMSPMFGAAAMSLSSFCVVSNSLRLGRVKLKKSDVNAGDVYGVENVCCTSNIKKENKNMEKIVKIVKIEGMMCPHCEARVKQVLGEIDGVESVEASHESKSATLRLSKDVSDDIIKTAIEAQGYKVTQ